MSSSQRSQSFTKSILTLPWTSRTYLLSLIIFHCLDIFYQQWSYIHLSSNFFNTILGYEFWRLLINFLYEPNTIVVTLVLLHLGYYLPKLVRFVGMQIEFPLLKKLHIAWTQLNSIEPILSINAFMLEDITISNCQNCLSAKCPAKLFS